jgi:hypothetical protein
VIILQLVEERHVERGVIFMNIHGRKYAFDKIDEARRHYLLSFEIKGGSIKVSQASFSLILKLYEHCQYPGNFPTIFNIFI